MAGRYPSEQKDGGLWEMPGLQRLVEQVVPTGREFAGFTVEGEFPAIGRRVMLVRGSRIEERNGLPAMILLSIQDVTAERSSG